MKTKLGLADGFVLKAIELGCSFELDAIVAEAWEYADLMCEEFEKREVLKSKATLTKDKEGNCLHLHQEFGQKKCMDCGVSLTNWQPDWSQAPSGFYWWAKDGFSNKAHWYSKEPFIDDEDDEYPNEWIQIENSYMYVNAPSFNYQGIGKIHYVNAHK